MLCLSRLANFFARACSLLRLASGSGVNVISRSGNLKLQVMQGHDIKIATGVLEADDAGNTIKRDADSVSTLQLTVSYAGLALEPDTYCGDGCLVGRVSSRRRPASMCSSCLLRSSAHLSFALAAQQKGAYTDGIWTCTSLFLDCNEVINGTFYPNRAYSQGKGYAPYQYNRFVEPPTMKGEASKGMITAQAIGGYKAWDNTEIQMDFETTAGDVKVVTNAGGLVGSYDLDTKHGKCVVNLENDEQPSCSGLTNGVGNAKLTVKSDYGTTTFSMPTGVSVPST